MFMSRSTACGRKILARTALGAGLAMALAGCSSSQELISTNPQSRAMGLKSYQAGEYTDAAASFREALRSDPRDYKSQFYLAQSYEKLGQSQQAIQAYKTSLDVQPTTLAGKDDKQQRLLTTDALAHCIATCDSAYAETNTIEQQAKSSNKASNYLLLAKIYHYRGDADSALSAYHRGALLDPHDFPLLKSEGLYLEQLGQKPRATTELQRAFALDGNDPQVNDALRRLGVVPGPALKSEEALAKPPVPEGPLPEVNLSNFQVGGQSNSQPPAAPSAANSAPGAGSDQAPAPAPGASFTPPPQQDGPRD
jgi:tetratricopeptide (TPR) repeat protein